jgi:hypothetical protein
VIQLVRPHRGPITQLYGNIQPDGMKHTGNDYGYTGDGQVFPEVFAAAAGVVLYAGDSRALGWPNAWYFNPDFDRSDAVDSSAGNVLVLGHVQNGVQFVTTNSHLESWLVRSGDTVAAGQHVATTGTTGRSTGKHLHFELLFKPLMFNTATYGRSDPNPYIIEGLAGQGTITQQEDDEMAELFGTVEAFRDRVVESVFDARFDTRDENNKVTGTISLRDMLTYYPANVALDRKQVREGLAASVKSIVAAVKAGQTVDPDAVAAQIADKLDGITFSVARKAD